MCARGHMASSAMSSPQPPPAAGEENPLPLWLCVESHVVLGASITSSLTRHRQPTNGVEANGPRRERATALKPQPRTPGASQRAAPEVGASVRGCPMPNIENVRSDMQPKMAK